MGILSWNKPEKVMTTEQWEDISADGAPPGVYVPNMSKEDQLKWKAKLTGKKFGYPQVEIRRNGMVLIVCLDKGYNYKTYKAKPDAWGSHILSTKGINIHMSSNNAQQLTFDEFEQMHLAVREAKYVLKAMEK